MSPGKKRKTSQQNKLNKNTTQKKGKDKPKRNARQTKAGSSKVWL